MKGLAHSLHALRFACTLALAAVVAACSGGAGTTENPVTSAPPVADYTGPAPQNADVQAFKLNLWENIKASNRCGGCHNAGGQVPQFARNDDVNAAYESANTVVNLTQPDQSRMVLKVAGGHNCWLASDSACADTLTVWIRNWAGATAVGGRQIELQAPTIKEVGASKTFPPNAADGFASTIYPVLTLAQAGNCGRCHSPGAATPQSPFFASPDVDEAYAAAKAKINLDAPAQSRFVLRLRDEFHNCWATPTSGGTPDCPGSATIMENAITNFASGISATQIDPALVVSKALTLYDGTVAAGGNRYDANVIALWEFKTGSGNIAYDTSGVEPALNLTLSSADMWVGGWGINIKAGQKAQGSTTASKKLADLIKSTGEFTIEAWMAPANVVQEDAYAVSYSAGTMARNVTLAQRAYQYEALTRTSETDANGMPLLITNAADRDAQASLQHVVLTYDPVNGRRLYVNGNYTGDADSQGGGSLSDWDDTFAFVLGNETSSNRQWQGVIRLVAVHNRALTQEQVQQNFAVGVGERYFLLFNVSHLVDVPQAYIMFEASQLDSYAYLFTRPTFISLDSAAQPGSISIKGMRIGINGSEAKVGQAYIPLSATIGGANYTASGQLLSSVGTSIALEKGPAADEFFLTFEQIGTHTHAVSEPPLTAGAPPADQPAKPDYGVRTFDEINATLAAITGVPTTVSTVATTYATVKQQLPTVESIDTFVASHQTGVAQLAIAYCSAMVDSSTYRNAFFGNGAIDPTAPGSFFALPANQGNRNVLINTLVTKAVGNLGTQPGSAEVSAELNALLDKLTGGANASVSGRAGLATKAACAAVLGSAVTLVQ